jgi:Protein of unknown function (DUF3017)
MANRPANAGSGGVGLDSAGSGRGLVPMGDATPPRARAPRPAAGHRAARPRTPNQDRAGAEVGALAWAPYLIVLAGAGLGISLAVREPKYAALGTGLLGASLLVAALARLALPERYAGLLASRRKASDVLAFAAFGAAVVAVALTLP